MSKRSKPPPNPLNTVELLRARGDELSLRAATLIETLQNVAYERGQEIRKLTDQPEQEIDTPL